MDGTDGPLTASALRSSYPGPPQRQPAPATAADMAAFALAAAGGQPPRPAAANTGFPAFAQSQAPPQPQPQAQSQAEALAAFARAAQPSSHAGAFGGAVPGGQAPSKGFPGAFQVTTILTQLVILSGRLAARSYLQCSSGSGGCVVLYACRPYHRLHMLLLLYRACSHHHITQQPSLCAHREAPPPHRRPLAANRPLPHNPASKPPLPSPRCPSPCRPSIHSHSHSHSHRHNHRRSYVPTPSQPSPQLPPRAPPPPLPPAPDGRGQLSSPAMQRRLVAAQLRSAARQLRSLAATQRRLATTACLAGQRVRVQVRVRDRAVRLGPVLTWAVLGVWVGALRFLALRPLPVSTRVPLMRRRCKRGGPRNLNGGRSQNGRRPGSCACEGGVGHAHGMCVSMVYRS